MKHLYKLLILFVVFGFSANYAEAQTSLTVTSLQKDTSATTWHLLSQQGSAKIYYQYVDCGIIEFVNFKVENTSNQAISVSWNFVFYQNGTALSSNPDDVNINMTLAPNEVKAGGCYQAANFPFSIFIREPNATFVITQISITNLLVTN